MRQAQNYVTAMITTQEFRQFSIECLKWADETANASDRQIIMSVANRWLKTASMLDRIVLNGAELTDDLRRKLD